MQTVDAKLDARGLNCPLPILKTRKLINGLDSGQVLEVTASDPGSVKDIESFCKQTGHQLLDSGTNDGTVTFLIRAA